MTTLITTSTGLEVFDIDGGTYAISAEQAARIRAANTADAVAENSMTDAEYDAFEAANAAVEDPDDVIGAAEWLAETRWDEHVDSHSFIDGTRDDACAFCAVDVEPEWLS